MVSPRPPDNVRDLIYGKSSSRRTGQRSAGRTRGLA